jgi:hypothetical protein
MRAVFKAAVIMSCALACGCKASASASVKTAKADEEANFDEPASTNLASPAAAPGADVALLGARHDLRLAASGKSPTCSCLAVALGMPNDPAIAWRSLVPQIDPASELVIALSSEGQSCPSAPKDSLGASYWGYKQVGSDVIVVVEAARSGRPVTGGAIIPKPIGDGQVYVQPLTKNLPYGRPLNATDKLCRVGK